ncbi:hypothetical protein JRO89_XS05G0251500 [Xanthoceras sorbifolium]|uniref:Uncharacterized protein n=1 Tax=Xanthoceras sorbifolium TaxID=99658 RepID=A0ABQ8I357_9ROSI|nr:hypothetical protein JRO89_XS05G0251500 [Xanthoceras sorbifolium]
MDAQDIFQKLFAPLPPRPVPDWEIIRHDSKKSENLKGVFRCFHFGNKYCIQTTEGSISSNNEQISIQLLDPLVIARNKQKYRYMHIGLIQVYVEPLLQGVNGSISLFMRDKRLIDFSDSFLNVPYSTKLNDPINFFPNFMVSLEDIDILHHLTLNVKFRNLQMEANRRPLHLTYKIHYKWTRDKTNPAAKGYGPGIEIVFSHTNMKSPNDLTPRIIKRSDVQFPEGWNVQDGIPEEQEHNSPRFIYVQGHSSIKLEFPKIHQ